jgi:putative two-component system response regulator
MGGKSLLIVDNDESDLVDLRLILEPEYELFITGSGLDALGIAARLKPDLILMDVQMPDMSGYEVCEALKANPATEAIPVIFITSLADHGNEANGFAAGCVDYLSKPVVPSIVLARIETHLSLVHVNELKKNQRDAVFMISEAGHYNDNDQGVHIWRMAAYAKALARTVGWSGVENELLELAAPMHDTGKIGIPDVVLRKPGKLDEDEWEVMRRHCQIGYDILSKSDSPLFSLAADIAMNHHEKWDGSGYPRGLAGNAIPEAARITTLADVFDALTMRRPYKEAWSVDEAFALIQDGAGSHFDPNLAINFIKIKPQILEIKARWALYDE